MKDKFFYEVKEASLNISSLYPRVASRMPNDLYTEVFTLYEMLRVADIIEESKPEKKELKESMLNAHADSLFLKKKSNEVKEYVYLHAEKRQDVFASFYYDMFFDIYVTLPKTAKDIIAETTKKMIPGMIDDSYLDIQTFAQQKKYAGYVAGELGLGLTGLFNERIHFSKKKKMLELGYNQGIASQKVNILRGIREDIAEGKNYVPMELLKKYNLDRGAFPNYGSSNEVIKELAVEAQKYLNDGLEYILNIPMTIRYPEYEYSKGIRTFMTGLVLMGQEMAYNIYNDPSLVIKGDYKPKLLILKNAYCSRHIWDDNKKIKKTFEKNKIE